MLANAQPVIVPSDGGNSSTDAVTVVYMEPSLVMSSSFTVVESCSTTSITFDPLFMDNGDKLRSIRADDLLMCQDYATIGTPEAYLGLYLQMQRVRVPLVPLVLLLIRSQITAQSVVQVRT